VPDDRERSDRRAATAAILAAAVMIAQQVGSKATRDALFLSSFEPEDLPSVVIASAVAAMITVLAASRAFSRFGPARAVPLTFAVSAALYLLEWILQTTAPQATAVLLYVHTAVFGALVVSGFWSVVNERFDPHTAKKAVSRIGMGATFGGVAGGLLAERMGAWGDASTMLVMLAALNAVAAFGVREIGGPAPSSQRTPEPTTKNALQLVARAPYLIGLMTIVVLTSMSAGLLDYAFKAEAAAHFEQGSDSLLSFFAIFHTAAALLSLMLQTGLAKPSLSRLGVAGTVATLPAVVLLSAAIAAAIPRIASIVVARAAELVVANSIFRSGYELLYTPVPPETKRPTKAFIDVAGNRLGDALGSGLTLIVLALAPQVSIPTVLGLAAAIAIASLVVARRLHAGYVRELEQSLRTGTNEDIAAMQAATLQSMSAMGMDREALFGQIAPRESWTERATTPSMDIADASELRRESKELVLDAPADDPVHERARVLRRGSADEMRAVLADDELDDRLVPLAIALLARKDVHEDAIAALRRSVDRVASEVVCALLDPEQPAIIRRRLPRVLAASERAEAAHGLTKALDHSPFEVRYRAAIALARITSLAPERRPTVERVHEVVSRELDAGRRAWDSRRLRDKDTDDEGPLLDPKLRDRLNKSVEFVFTVLSLTYDPEPLRLSLFALAGDDRGLRGTALEYLENVLPEEIRASLFPMLDVRVEIGRKRSRQEIVDELVGRSMQNVDARALREAIEKNRGPGAGG
jgi:AAA family ATP:ADP antiporter